MFYGCGLGLVLPTTNVLVARLNPGREASAVSLVNVWWAAGAVAWPVIVSALSTAESVTRPLTLLAALLAIMCARLVWAHAASVVARSHEPGAATPGDASAPAPRVPAFALVATFASLLALYSGSEASIGGWIAEHVHRLGSDRWAMATTLFWLAISLGRLLTPLALSRFSERRVLVAASVALTAAIVAGLGLSPVFPVTFGALTRDVAPSRPHLVGPLYACTGVGSGLLPWLVGAGSTFTGSLRLGLLVPVVGTAGLLALSLLRLRLSHGEARVRHVEA
jgi:fucose permease